jgi:hypothetical protein
MDFKENSRLLFKEEMFQMAGAATGVWTMSEFKTQVNNGFPGQCPGQVP